MQPVVLPPRYRAGIQRVNSIGEGLQIVLLKDSAYRFVGVGCTVEMKTPAADSSKVTTFISQQFGQCDLIARKWSRKSVMRAATGDRPVINAARDGTHCGAAVKKRWNFIPSVAN